MRHFPFLCLLIKLAVLAGLPLLLFPTGAVAALTTPNYVQSNYAVPQTPQTSVTVPYTGAQSAGNLNVVIVGWSDSTAIVKSLTDSMGNVYQLAVGPMVTGGLSQAIYYAKNISAAASAKNAVTVTFNTAATYPDIRVLEYSGINPVNPVDTVAGATGTGETSSSGALRTTNATDLLVAANTVQNTTIGTSSGFTQRMLTEPDGDIAEDQIVTVAGSYSAATPLLGGSGWVMQMVAFRAGGSASPTPTPTPRPTPTPTPAALGFVQGNYAVPQTPQTAVTVPYTGAQTAGDLNVVIVGWNDTTAQIASVTDTNGNRYQLAIGPTVLPGALSQAIFYANDISAATAGANAVTLTFNPAATYPDIRILEYSGIVAVSPVDKVVAATGTSLSSSSGAVTTTNSTDLLVGANTVSTGTTGPGSGFTQRLLTEPDSDIAEDQIARAAGSYNATAPLSYWGPWVMQMVAFRASSGPNPTPTPRPTPTPTPRPTPTPTPTPAPTPTPTQGSSVTLAWDANPPTKDPTTNTTGYNLYLGLASGNYTQSTDVGKTTKFTVSNLTSGTTYYSVLTAYDSAGVESPPSNEVSFTAP